MRAGLAASGPRAAFEAMLRFQALRLRAPAHRYRQSCSRIRTRITSRAGALPWLRPPLPRISYS